MVTVDDYNELAVQAARSVLLEILRVLGEYKDSIVLIGGWVPQMLFPNSEDLHTGSIDVDLAMDHEKLTDEGYRSINDLLLSRGYKRGKQPFIFHRSVRVSGVEIDVGVDLLSGEYGGTGKSHRHQKIQNVHARKVRGCDLVFKDPVEREIAGRLPGGSLDSAVVKVASIVPFITMKAIVLDERLKEKDAYDIYYCLKQYAEKLEDLVPEFQSRMKNKLVREGLEKLAKNFASTEHTGPRFVSDFQNVADEEERAMLERDVFERVDFLLRKLGIV